MNFWIILACVIGYIVMALLTIFLMILVDRLNGETPQNCYSKYFDYYAITCFIGWIIAFPYALLALLTKYYKKWLIFFIVAIVASKEKKNGEANDN